MANLEGKKPITNAWYQNRHTGEMIQVVDKWDHVILCHSPARGDNLNVNLIGFYDRYKRVKDYVPPFKSELENE